MTPSSCRKKDKMSTDEDKLKLYIAQGETCFRKGDYKRAVNAYTEALGIKVDDRNLLLARSQCYVALGQAKEAIEDANECIKSDETFYKGLYQKAEALYAAGEFEFALVYYYRAHRLRTDILEYRLGIQKAEQAILRAISQDSGASAHSGKYENTMSGNTNSLQAGNNNNRKKNSKGSLNGTNGLGGSAGNNNSNNNYKNGKDGTGKSLRYRTNKNEESVDIPDIAAPQTVYGHVFNQKPPVGIASGSGRSNSKTGRSDNSSNGDYMGNGVLLTTPSGSSGHGGRNKKAPELTGKAHPSQRLLGELYEDRKFLEDLKRDGAISNSKDSGISKIVDAGIEYIDARTEFWRQQKPPTVDNNDTSGAVGSGINSVETGGGYGGNTTTNNGNSNGNGMELGNTYSTGNGKGYTSTTYGKQGSGDYNASGNKVDNSVSRQVSRSLTYIQQSLSNILSALSKGTPALALQIAQALIRRVEEATNTVTGALRNHPDRDKIRCDCFTSLGWSYFDGGDYGKAFMAYERAFEEINHGKGIDEGVGPDDNDDYEDQNGSGSFDCERMIRSIRNLARSSQRTPDTDRTSRYYMKMLDLAASGYNKNKNDNNSSSSSSSSDNNNNSECNVPRVYIMDSYIQLARLAFDAKDYNAALEYANNALQLAYPNIIPYLDQSYDKEACMKNGTDIETDYEKAVDMLDQDLLNDITAEQSTFEQSIPIYPLDPTAQELLLDTLCLIGRIWYMQKEYDIAYRALRVCQVLARVFCDDAAEGASMTNLCFVCSKMGKESEAKEWEEKARAVIGEVE